MSHNYRPRLPRLERIPAGIGRFLKRAGGYETHQCTCLVCLRLT